MFVCQAVDSEMDEIVRAMSAENDRLLSATDSSSQRRRRHSSVSDVTTLSRLSYIVSLLHCI